MFLFTAMSHVSWSHQGGTPSSPAMSSLQGKQPDVLFQEEWQLEQLEIL